MKSLVLGVIVVLFIGCGSSNNTKEPVGVSSDAPKSPITKEKGQTPPSIPKI